MPRLNSVRPNRHDAVGTPRNEQGARPRDAEAWAEKDLVLCCAAAPPT